MKCYSDPVEEHPEVPLADDGRWEDLIERRAALRDRPAAEDGHNACYVVSHGAWRSPEHRAACLAEVLGLVRALDDDVVGYESIPSRSRSARAHSRYGLGTGTCEAIAERARAAGATLLVLDVALTPSQTRNLEDATGLAVQDREGLILAVFHRNARTRKARIQVEIAQLQYLRPRIRGLGLDMDQQAGGIMMGKGAGETASELLARRLDDRLAHLRRTFEQLERADTVHRKGRGDCARVALVGYTNAGKTSLMNALTGASLSVRDQPFETLDTTSRALTRSGGAVLLGDTVGFIRDLPPRLMASFASTLSEIRDATLLAMVVDLSDPEWGVHLAITHQVLAELGADGVDRLYVLNKVDRVGVVPNEAIRAAVGGHPYALVSAHDPVSVDALRAALIEAARAEHRTERFEVPYVDGALAARIHATCDVVDVAYGASGQTMTVRAPERVLAALRHARATKGGR
jgi:GTP-binding protein HflX